MFFSVSSCSCARAEFFVSLVIFYFLIFNGAHCVKRKYNGGGSSSKDKTVEDNLKKLDDPEFAESFLKEILSNDVSDDQVPVKNSPDSKIEDNHDITKSTDDPELPKVSVKVNVKSEAETKRNLEVEESSFTSNFAQQLYKEGLSFLERADILVGLRKNALGLLREAARQGHIQSKEHIATATLLGWDSNNSLERAYLLFNELAMEGNPRGQFGLGLMYSAGLHLNSSVPHSLIYFTFSALGGDHLANMALGYRYWAGIGVEEDCEAALTHYHRVASVVFKDVSERALSGGPTLLGPLIRRARLLDEVDNLDGSDGDLTISEDLFQYYQYMADKKNVSAMVGLGQLYYYGRHGIEMDHEKAFYFFNLAVESGSALAMAYLGEMYMVGSDAVPKDTDKALQYLRKSAEENNPIGLTGLALAYLYGRAGLPSRPFVAVELFLKAADQGWAEAQLYLGRLFLGTSDIKADYKLALKYFTMASQQGNTMAFYHLGEMHAQGIGVLRSCNTATELFKNVAERGRWSKWFMSAYAAFRDHRYDEAVVTYYLLAELGYEVAQSNVAFILEEGKSSLIPAPESQKRAFNQWQRSATQGSTTSRVKLGDYFYYGLGTEPNYHMAIQQYRIASNLHHNAQAMFNLGYMHERGLGLKRDLHLAKRFYDMAAEASTDARIAVSIALARLMIYFLMDYFSETNFTELVGDVFTKFMSTFSSRPLTSSSGVHPTDESTSEPIMNYSEMDWDFYAIPLLAGLLLFLLVYIRQRAT